MYAITCLIKILLNVQNLETWDITLFYFINIHFVEANVAESISGCGKELRVHRIMFFLVNTVWHWRPIQIFKQLSCGLIKSLDA